MRISNHFNKQKVVTLKEVPSNTQIFHFRFIDEIENLYTEKTNKKICKLIIIGNKNLMLMQLLKI